MFSWTILKKPYFLYILYFTIFVLQEQIVLLTGTPLQNNTEELFSLLNFLNPRKFDSYSSFMKDFGDLKTEEQVDRLKEVHSFFVFIWTSLWCYVFSPSSFFFCFFFVCFIPPPPFFPPSPLPPPFSAFSSSTSYRVVLVMSLSFFLSKDCISHRI